MGFDWEGLLGADGYAEVCAHGLDCYGYSRYYERYNSLNYYPSSMYYSKDNSSYSCNAIYENDDCYEEDFYEDDVYEDDCESEDSTEE